jgi:hypothetical protein
MEFPLENGQQYSAPVKMAPSISSHSIPFINITFPSKLSQAVTLPSRILEISGSNLGRYIGNPEVYLGFYQSIKGSLLDFRQVQKIFSSPSFQNASRTQPTTECLGDVTPFPNTALQ